MKACFLFFMLTIDTGKCIFDWGWIDIAHKFANKLQLTAKSTARIEAAGEHDRIKQLLIVDRYLFKLRLR